MATDSTNLSTLPRPSTHDQGHGDDHGGGSHPHDHAGGDDHGTALYKPGQGYWVRVLTAVALAVLFMATALWTAKQLELVRLPTPTTRVTVTDATALPKVGETVTLVQTSKTGAATSADIGTAVVKSVSTDNTGRNIFLLGDANPIPSKSLLDATNLRGPTFTATIARQEGIPIFQPLYLQGGAAAVIILIGFIVTYWVVGRNHAAVDFLVATDGEMKKVNWSTRKTIIDSTWVVIGACVLISAFLYLIDIFFQTVFRFLKISE